MLINKSKGTTTSEKFLAKLAEKTFLNLWSYPNLYNDKGIDKLKIGQELCDLLVVFNNHVIIFSDKSIEFKNKNEVEEDWKKWAKQAICKSSNQVFGAERWMRMFPDRVYLDKTCNEKFPFNLPNEQDMIIHRVVVTSFSGEALKNHIGDTGAFTINPLLRGEKEHLNTPFAVGQINPSKGFVHIMNETSLQILMTELDTISDFTTYLLEKENFIQSGQLFKSHSEEDLLTAYIENIDDEDNHSFYFNNGNQKIEIEKNIWINHKDSERYILKKFEEQKSYIWDDMINRLTKDMLEQKLIEQSSLNPLEFEKALRIMATENRLNRRSLSKHFLELFEKFQQSERKNLMLKRVVFLGDNEIKATKAYVFLIANKPENLNYESYQNERKYQLFSYVLALKSKHPELLDIVGISREASFDEAASNDIVYLDGREWKKDEQEEAEKMCLEHGYLKDKNIQKFSREEVEYPYIN